MVIYNTLTKTPVAMQEHDKNYGDTRDLGLGKDEDVLWFEGSMTNMGLDGLKLKEDLSGLEADPTWKTVYQRRLDNRASKIAVIDAMSESTEVKDFLKQTINDAFAPEEK